MPGTPRRWSPVVVVLEVVLPVAEEREVVGAQPLEEGDAPLELVGGDRGGGSARSSSTITPGLLAHPVPVLDGLADVAQHPLHVVGDRVDVLVVPDPADLDVHPRLALGALGRLGGLVVGAGDVLEPAGHVAGDVELRVDRPGGRRAAAGSAPSTTESTRNGMSSVTTSTTE